MPFITLEERGKELIIYKENVKHIMGLPTKIHSKDGSVKCEYKKCLTCDNSSTAIVVTRNGDYYLCKNCIDILTKEGKIRK